MIGELARLRHDFLFTFALFFPGISDFADVVLRRPRDVNITSGTEVTLKCDVQGSSPLQINWYKNKRR